MGFLPQFLDDDKVEHLNCKYEFDIKKDWA